ncbi:hypothetical protein HBN50_09870 [Halobacteriovorax sp. GB3]|uniref:hypothetical protein n=1 Tax=Halobacteriovorax sp. GB3 TaxID=2719615 RepID=UPI0023607D4E|nr:hypothetical protein [Halobacteriovorax sp. GB3]MDD0853406.1 hypothetical protein [Halobacteriovorax sp. GB3]
MKKKIFFVFLILIAIFAAIGWGILSFPVSNGLRAGKLVKITKKGVLFKTYEGTLDLGSGDHLTWDFSVHDDALGREMQNFSGQQVKLEYKEHLFRVFYSSKYDITSVKRIDDGQHPKVLLCRLVNILRKNGSVVRFIRPMIKLEDPELLNVMRECQIN